MEKEQSTLKKGLLMMAMSVLCILSCFMIAKPKEVEAAASYKEIEFYGEPTKPVKVGKYYYKYKYNTGRLYYSKKKSSGYHKTKISQEYGLWSNGKYIYYINSTNYNLYRYNISKKTTKKIKSLSSAAKNGDTYMEISKFYKGKIYFTVEDERDWCYRTYYYNKNSKKIKKAKSNCAIVASSGQYCVCQKQYVSEYAPVTLYLGKINSSGGIKKVKTLTKKGDPLYGVKASGGKFYYVTWGSGYSFNKFSVYRIKKNGSAKKKMVTVSSSSYKSVHKLTSKYVQYYDGSKLRKKTF